VRVLEQGAHLQECSLSFLRRGTAAGSGRRTRAIHLRGSVGRLRRLLCGQPASRRVPSAGAHATMHIEDDNKASSRGSL
jgi:hypothetical protein